MSTQKSVTLLEHKVRYRDNVILVIGKQTKPEND